MSKSNYNPEIHHRHSLRLRGYDYASAAAYYVTLCTMPRRPIFENPVLRTILNDTWQEMPGHIKSSQLDAFMIMRDHIHFIVLLDREVSDGKTLSDFVGTYKSLTFMKWYRHIKANGLNERAKFWQTSFVERVLRNDFEMKQKREYILNNPTMEDLKREHAQREAEMRQSGKFYGPHSRDGAGPPPAPP
jgi:putative transposase